MQGLKLVLSAVLAGLVVTITSFLAVAQNADVPIENFVDINQITWGIIIAGGLLVATQNIQTYLKRPPEGGKFLKPTED